MAEKKVVRMAEKKVGLMAQTMDKRLQKVVETA
jgi:hypothetical protein